MNKEKRNHEIHEQRGLWAASCFISSCSKKIIKNNFPIEITYLLKAHKILFEKSYNEKGIAGRYRDCPAHLIRIDGTRIDFPPSEQVPHRMAILNDDLIAATSDLKAPTTKEEFEKVIDLCARMSHRFVCIHPFTNGNGRTSRLLMNLMLLKTDFQEIPPLYDKKLYRIAMHQADKGSFDQIRLFIMKGLILSQKKIFNKQVSLERRKKLSRIARTLGRLMKKDVW